MVAMGIESPS